MRIFKALINFIMGKRGASLLIDEKQTFKTVQKTTESIFGKFGGR